MRNKKRIYLIICIISFFIVVVALGAIGFLLFSLSESRSSYAQLAKDARSVSSTVPTNVTVPMPSEAEEIVEQTQPVLVDIPINFDFLQEKNPDIIGWITVDGTDIDFPILYDTTYNRYYLKHNYEGTYTNHGSIFVLGENSNDFSDFNTVVYGHNNLDGHMFAPLHSFRDKDFFDAHGQFVIYTPDRVLTYEIFALYRTDNLNIVVNNDFSTEELREQYIESIYARTDTALFKPEYEVTASDRIVTLSTCIGNPSYRFVLHGVLVSEEMGIFADVPEADEGTNES